MSIVEKVKMLSLTEHGDDRGRLVIVEGAQDIPFEIKRIFCVFGADANTVRGQHANRNSEFVMINMAGSCKVRVKDGTGFEAEYSLDRPNVGLYLPRMVWKDMFGFSKDSVLLCLSSEHYDPDEYIRDYAQYVTEMEGTICGQT